FRPAGAAIATGRIPAGIESPGGDAGRRVRRLSQTAAATDPRASGVAVRGLTIVRRVSADAHTSRAGFHRADDLRRSFRLAGPGGSVRRYARGMTDSQASVFVSSPGTSMPVIRTRVYFCR